MSDTQRIQILDLPLGNISPAACKGRTFIVTGANTGLGYEAVKHLATFNASRIILAVRNIEAGEKAKTEIQAAASNSSAQDTTKLEVWPLDLSSYASIKAFAKRANEELERVDVLINNAGIAAAERIVVEDHVITSTVNVLGTMLLSILLLPKMKQTAAKFGGAAAASSEGADGAEGDGKNKGAKKPHVVFVASSAGFGGAMGSVWEKTRNAPILAMDELSKERMMVVYPLSKNVLIQTVRHFANHVLPTTTEVVVNVINPGLCETGLDRYAPPEIQQQIRADRARMGRTAEQGSRTLLHGAFVGDDGHGRFLDDCRIADDALPSWMTGPDGDDSARNSWEAVRDELEKVMPGCIDEALVA